MSTRRACLPSSFVWLPLLAMVVTSVAVAPAAAQNADPAPTSTSAPGVAPSTTAIPPTTGVPGGPPASIVDPAATTTTEPFGDSLEGGHTSYGGQNPFDPASRAVMVDRLALERRRLSGLEADLIERRAEQAVIAESVALLEAEVADREARSDASIDAAASARRAATDAAVEAYVNGDERAQLAGTIGDPITYSRARTYLGALSAKRRQISNEYQDLAGRLDDEQRSLARDLADGRGVADRAQQDALSVETEIRYATQNIDALERGSHVVVDGLVFPVAGPVHFVDSWGFPRLSGTSQSHWHEGIDIMAPTGRELVATESGVLERVGVAGLGGNRLWLIGDSGTEYYYAHLSGYATGLADGQRVDAGQLIAYVGATGGASGGPPHLHMQIHPGGGDPVNPFPVLRAALGEDPVPIQSVALAGPVTVLAGSTPVTPPASVRPLVPWLVSPTASARSRLMTWMSTPH